MIKDILAKLAHEDNLRRLPDIKCAGKYIVDNSTGGWSGNGAGNRIGNGIGNGIERRYLNFSSNDYLGLACGSLYKEFMRDVCDSGEFLLSNPSSRLITGNSPDYTRLEQAISDLYGGGHIGEDAGGRGCERLGGRAALVLGSGYLANSGVLPAVTFKGDLILADKLVHASIIDGLRLCEAEWTRFAHNDMDHLETLLKKACGCGNYTNIWVVTESIFSMDGDTAPLIDIVALKQKYGFKIYIDEAHAFGVRGENGQGLASEIKVNGAQSVEEHCDIIIATLGKAIASQGAFVLTDPQMRELLVNRMRTLIFSTALPPISLRWSEYVISRLPQMEHLRSHLRELVEICGGETQIIPIIAGENNRALEMSLRFREEGFWAMPVRYPTVPKGAARVRVSLSAALSKEDVERFMTVCRNIG